MQDINEEDSVVLNTDHFHTNGKVAKVISVNRLGNRCTVITEDNQTMTISLNEVTKRSLLSE